MRLHDFATCAWRRDLRRFAFATRRRTFPASPRNLAWRLSSRARSGAPVTAFASRPNLSVQVTTRTCGQKHSMQAATTRSPSRSRSLSRSRQYSIRPWILGSCGAWSPPAPIRPGPKARPFPSPITRYRISPERHSGETARPAGGRIPEIHEVDQTRHPEPLPDHAKTNPATWLADSFGPGSRIQRPVSVPRDLQTQ